MASGTIWYGIVVDFDESLCAREISQLVAKELKRIGDEVNQSHLMKNVQEFGLNGSYSEVNELCDIFLFKLLRAIL